MANLRIHYRILASEYDRFLCLLVTDYDFPVTFGEWTAQTEKRILESRRDGFEVQPLTIHPNEFLNWCKHSGKQPSTAMLSAFTLAKATRQPVSVS